MRVTSTDHRSWIEVLREGDKEHCAFAVSCSVDIGHGRFTGTNLDVPLLNLPAFAQAMDQFILDRTLQPILEGAYDTYVKVSSPSGLSVVMLSFAIGDAYCGSPATSRFKLEGEFPIDQEFLVSIVDGFRKLAVDA